MVAASKTRTKTLVLTVAVIQIIVPTRDRLSQVGLLSREALHYIAGFSRGERLGKHCLSSAERWNREMAVGMGLSTDIESRK